MNTRDKAAAVDAWRRALDGFDEPALVRPGLVDKPADLANAGEVHRPLPPALAERLDAVARDQGVTPSTLFETAWGLALMGLTGRDDVVFGASVSGRHPDVDGVESMVGLLFNTIPVRVQAGPADALAAVLDRVQAAQSELFDHSYVALADVQRATGLGTLFDTLFVFQNFPACRPTAASDRTAISASSAARSATPPTTRSPWSSNRAPGSASCFAGTRSPRPKPNASPTATSRFSTSSPTTPARRATASTSSSPRNTTGSAATGTRRGIPSPN